MTNHSSRFSPPDPSEITFTRDQKSNEILAHSSGTACGNGDREESSVNLDLRKSRPGAYFLSTAHEQDQASCYDLLQIK
jgi:hypothetical protein